ncbi:MAG: serine/threonine-protein kinase [Candidatus Competibacter sp.]|jgi:serine/threonine-protein kinase PpkA|nr:serine/threonine-protein kinase [Candidatus Competibacter sp.]
MEMPRISGYQFEKIIGKGAMSTVYLALQESLGRRVAIKVLSPGLAGDPIFSKRFIKEARIIGKLGHPHIVTIFDAGNLDDVYYIAMEYLEGGTLKERIKAGLTPDQAVTILCQIARALGRAHQQHCIHRDIKPANILFRNPDTALLSDFGIAKNTLDKTQLTAAGWRLGTPNYMSPEQALAKPTDARSDLYSLGVVFYEMLTGTRPFQGADAFDIALKHLKEPVPTLPEPLGRFQPAIDRLLAKESEERFASAEELVEAVQDAIAGKTAAISRPPKRKAAVKPIRDVTSVQVPASAAPPWRRALPWILAGLLAGLAASLVYWFWPALSTALSSIMRPSD